MAMNMKTLTQALAKTAAVIEKTVQTTVQEVAGPKPLQDYELLNQVGSAGPGLAWKLYSARARAGGSAQYPTVCVWMLDKRALSEGRSRAGLSKAAEDSFFNIIRQDAARLVRIRHPGVVHVVQALDENKNAMAMVTEPLFASIANAIGDVGNISEVPKELKGMEMGLLEVKHGLLQVAESLDFLHNNAHLIHRAVAPESILITASGAWKLGGFGFAIPTDQASGDSQAFHYAEYDVEDSILPLQPSLNYTAPELVRSKTFSGGCCSDIFSFGCLAYHLIARKPLLDCHNNVKMYMNTLHYLSSEAFSSIPPELVSDLQRMLSVNESFRPTAMDFTGSLFFRNDTRLRALRFLDHMIERDNMQKTEFLKALTEMWKDFDSRVLRYKVLPPLCAELRNLVMQPMILPMVLTVAESQDKNDFELSTLPALLPVLSSASGDTLLLLVRHAELITDKTSQDHLISHVLPMLVRAYDDTDPRLQEEVLKRTVSLAKHLDRQLVKQAIVPRVHGLALRTTIAAVRVNALRCLGDMVHTLDKPAALDILQTIQRCTSVDRSPPTLMCTLGVSNSVLKQYGTEFAAEHVLPVLAPLLIAQQLNVQQFAKYMHFVKDILRKIEEKRGVAITDTGIPEVKTSLADGRTVDETGSGPFSLSDTANLKKSPSWDEDWGPSTRVADSSIRVSSFSMPSLNPVNDFPSINSGPSMLSNSPAAATQTTTCPAIDIEWPPRPSSGSIKIGSDTKGQIERISAANLEDDPFADWPPRSSCSINGSGSTNNGNAGLFGNNNGSNTSINSSNGVNFQNACGHSFVKQPSHNQMGLTLNSFGPTGVGNPNSLGSLKQYQGYSSSSGMPAEKKASDLGSIFSSGRNEQSAFKLAPPPPTAVGRGRGRGRGAQGHSSAASRPGYNKPESDQPPLLDLL